MLASPKSASMTNTRLFKLDKYIARLTEKLDLPTPPLPLLIVITLELRLFLKFIF